jgi:hypothetical protein
MIRRPRTYRFDLTSGVRISARRASTSFPRAIAGHDRLQAEGVAMRADLVVGRRLPDLELPDHRRRSVRLSALANGYPLIVSFYRGYW